MLIDSNVLVYALNDSSPKQKAAREFFIANQDELVLSHQNITETLRVITHPKFQNPYTISKALKRLSYIINEATTIHPNSHTLEIFTQLIKKNKVTGSQIFDAYLVATAISNGVNKIATDNEKHLGTYQQIKVINPFR